MSGARIAEPLPHAADFAAAGSRTKIVGTLGPASSTPAVIGALIDAGLSVARINFSHGTHEQHARTIALVPLHDGIDTDLARPNAGAQIALARAGVRLGTGDEVARIIAEARPGAASNGLSK